MNRTESAVRALTCTALFLFLSPTAIAIDETRRQVGSELINQVFGVDGTGVNIGQIELDEPLAHANVPFNGRGGGGLSTDLHALEVASIMVSNHATFTGMAPGATLRSDDYTNNGVADTTLSNDNNILNALTWTTTAPQSARVVNSSFGYVGATTQSTALHKVTLGIDWQIANNDVLFVKSAGNNGAKADISVTSPGAAFNGIAVGDVIRSAADGPTSEFQGSVSNRWDILDLDSSYTTDNGIPKPDIVAPGGRKRLTGFNMAQVGNGFGSAANRVGTSYAAPHVSGVAAQLYELDGATNHRTMKAALLNAADKTVRDRTNQPWTTAGGSHGLDNQLGTGFLNAWGSAVTLAAPTAMVPGQNPGRVGTIEAFGGPLLEQFYVNGTAVGPDSRLVATVVWDRNVIQDTNAPNGPVPMEVYSAPANMQSQFELRFNGPATFTQNSASGSVQHLNVVTTTGQAGNYSLSVKNTGETRSPYSVAYAISPMDVNPGEQNVFFTVRDQVHVPTAGDNDRMREGRAGTAVRTESDLDAAKAALFGVETTIFKSTMNINNTVHTDGQLKLGLTATDAFADDAINALSFGRDDIAGFQNNGGHFMFSVDTYATGLSPFGVDNPHNGVFSEATIVNEAAGDIFRSPRLLPGADPTTNQNVDRKNIPDIDSFHPENNLNANTTFADSYYLGLGGPEVADNEDDLTSLEGLGEARYDSVLPVLDEGFTFFSLDRTSPSGHTADILVGRDDMPGEFKVYASAGQLGLLASDNLDALLVQHLGGLDDMGWPVYDPFDDLVIFSVDRDSVGDAGSAVNSEHIQGEAASDLFFATAGASNSLFLEATDIGLQEVALGSSMNWLTDNLDALDIRDVTDMIPVPEPAAVALMLFACCAIGIVRRRR